MKHLLLFFLLLLSTQVSAQELPDNDWRMGFTPSHIRSEMLGEPGWRLRLDTLVTGRAKLVQALWFETLDKKLSYMFFFEDGYSVANHMVMNGIHKEDIDEKYSVLYKLKANYWIDKSGRFSVFLHREYNGPDTLIIISLYPND